MVTAAAALLSIGTVLANPVPASAATLESPASASAVGGRRLIEVTWTAPTAPTVPVARYRAAAGGQSCDLSGPFSGPLTCTINNLDANTSYTATVVACPNADLTNNTDCSVATSANSVRTGPPGTPSAPTVSFVGNPNTVRLNWDEPDVGAGIASYRIAATPSTGLTGTCGSLVQGNTRTCDFAGLTDDTSYTFRITAIGTTTGTVTSGTSLAGPASVPKVAGLPKKPAKPTLTRVSDTQVTVSFAKPSGNQAISGYTVTGTAGDGTTATCTATASQTSCPVLNLDAGKQYSFTVVANGETAAAGVSPASDPSDPIKPGLPLAPATPTIELGAVAGKVTVLWDQPSGGGTVTSHSVTSEPFDAGTPLSDAACTSLSASATRCDYSGLENGKKYRFKVTANSAAGPVSSAWSDPVVSELPAAPVTPTVVLGDAPGKVRLTWAANATGGPVIYYAVTAIPTSGANTGTPAAGCGFNLTSPSCDISGLTTTTSYTFRVTAIGDLGTASSAQTAAIVPDAPGAPTTPVVALTGNSGEANVTWVAPAVGGTVASYTVTETPAGGSEIDVCTGLSAGTTNCLATGLDTTKSHTFKIKAINLAGSATVTAVATTPNVPTAPRTPAVALSGSAGTAVVSWTAPVSGTVARYIVTTTSTDQSATLPNSACVDAVAALTCTVGGLSTDKPYRFTVRAQNLLGWADAAPTAAIVLNKPTTPTNVSVTVTAPGNVTVAWTAPTGATSGPVTSYTVTATSPDGGTLPGESPCTVDLVGSPGATLQCAFTGLAADKSYQFTVRAINADGGTDAALTAAATAAAPAAPGNVHAVLGNLAGKVTVTWDASVGGAVTGYTVTATSGTGGATSPVTCSKTPAEARSCEFTTLTSTASYVFKVTATNAVGSTDSTDTEAMTPDVPGQPTAVNVNLGNGAPGTATVTWGVPSSGGTPTGYTVTPVSATTGATIPAVCAVTSDDARSCPFTGLTQTATYTFQVRAANTAGASVVATSSAVVPSAPGAATNLAVTLGTNTPGTATVTWSPPTGGATVVGYTVSPLSSTGGANIPADCTKSTSDPLSCVFSGLTATATYTFRVRTTNVSGDTDISTPAVRPNVAGTPTGVTVTLGNAPGKATVTWAEPTNLGPALTYTVTAASGTGGATIPANCIKNSTDTRSCEYTDLTPGAEYTFTVRAANPSGGTNAATTEAVKPDKPGVPTGVTAVQGNAAGKATVSWTAPTDRGAPESFLVTATPAGGGTPTTCTKIKTDPTSCTLTGLDGTKAYSFTVAAINLAGNDSVATAAETFVPNTPVKPGPVTVTLDEAVPGKATVTWVQPIGAVVTGWTVTPTSVDGGATITACNRTAMQTTECVFTGLTTIASYSFTVRASNLSGYTDSDPTAPVIANKPNPPGTPVALPIAVDKARVTWTAPVGGGLVTKYAVVAYAESAPATGINSTPCANVTTGLTCDFDMLSTTESYRFKVTAYGAVGSTVSAASAAITTAPPAKPGTPQVELAGPNAVRVTWTGPSPGGSVASYSVISVPALSAPPRCTDTHNLTCVFDRLTAGTTYTFTVVAAGSFGTLTSSDASASILVGPAGAPERVTATPTANGTTVTVSWTAPTADGTVAGYTVESMPGQFGCNPAAGASATSCTVTGLDSKTEYRFRVKTVGATGGGDSPFSAASDPVTPGAPVRPTNVEVAAGSGQIAVAWTAPASLISRVAHYRATTFPGGFFCVTDSNTQTECLINGVTNLTSYTVTVAAIGSDGSASPASEPSSRVRPTAGAPGRPTAVHAVSGNTSALVSWTAPVMVGDGIGRYRVTVSNTTSTHGCTVPGDTTSCPVTGLSNNQEYQVTVVAIGRLASGYSSPSASTTVKPMVPPSAPTIVSVTGGVKTLVVKWTAGSLGDGVAGFTATAGAGSGTPLSCTAAATATSCTIADVPAGTYSVTVVANGTEPGVVSPASAATSGAPLVAPGAPTIVSVTGGVKTLAVQWTAGSPGDGVSTFTATATPTVGTAAALSCTAEGNAATCTIANLTPGTYSVSVVAYGNQAALVSEKSSASEATALLALPPTPLTTAPTTTTALTSSVTSVKVGGSLTVTGSGFAPFTGVALALYTGAVKLTTVATDANGGFTTSVTIPSGTIAGSKTIIAGGLPPTGTTVRYQKATVTVTTG
ncbi:fibronectin type III domain-containing protein [Micromonosporaceae bacterium Da 78-11]